MIKLYIYEIESGKYKYNDNGMEDAVLYDIPDGHDFTLKEPPNTYESWKWVDDTWILA